MLECLKTFFQWLIPSEQQCQHTGDWWHHHCWPIEPGRSSYSWREDSHLVEESQAFSTVKKSCFFKWVSTSWLWYGHFFSRIMMLNSSIALDIICHIFLNTGAMFLYFKVQIIKTFKKKYRFGQLLVFPWQFERRLSDWHWFCPDSPHSWPWTRLFVHRLYPPCSTLSKKRKQYRYSMYFILNFSFI